MQNLTKQNATIQPLALPVINFVPPYLPLYLICMQAVEQTKPKMDYKKQKKGEVLTCSLQCLFMKALPGTMETNYLLTMWNRILFTRLCFPLLFQMRFFTASSFVSHSIIVSIFQNQSVSREEQEGGIKDDSLLFIKQAIRCIYECTPHPLLATDNPFLCAHPSHPSV